MMLRWYQTYDKYGMDSETSLQYRECEHEEWENVEFVREREDKNESDKVSCR